MTVALLSTPGGGAYSRVFTTNLAPECRAFSKALKIEKLKNLAILQPKRRGMQMTCA